MLATEHFVIHFHQGEERLAQRLAVIAEDTWIALERPLGLAPPRKTRVVLADQTELFNGYALAAFLMLVAAAVARRYGVAAERRSLEDITAEGS